MISWLKELDGVLRGRKAEPELLAKGMSHIRIAPLAGVCVVLGVIYGIFMGLFSVLTRTPPCFEQMAAAAVKVPALFFLTLVVTFPSLYVFSALLGVPLGPKDVLRLILLPVVVTLAVLASLGPITGFFTLNTTNYPFMKLLNVFFFSISGIIGLKVLLNTLTRLEVAQVLFVNLDEPLNDSASKPPRPVSHSISARRTFRVWLVIYALVGAQMGWVLRPFIGAPDLPFKLFRGREANIFIDVLRTIRELFTK